MGQALNFEDDQLSGHIHTYKRTDHSQEDGNICGTDVAGCSSKHNLENPTEDSLDTGGPSIRAGAETRPKSMVVVYIIKCW